MSWEPKDGKLGARGVPQKPGGWKGWVIALVVVALMALAVFLAGCDTRHVVEVCIRFDTITVSDSLIVVSRLDC